MDSKTHVFEATRRLSPGRQMRTNYIKVTACLHYIEGNSAPYFSVTAEGRDRGSEFGGCCHDMILKQWPRLAPIVAMHLSNADGEPMYAAKNGLYHMGIGRYSKRNLDYVASHYRLSGEDAAELVRVIEIAEGMGCAEAAIGVYCDTQRPFWAGEAANAVRLLDQFAAAAEVN